MPTYLQIYIPTHLSLHLSLYLLKYPSTNQPLILTTLLWTYPPTYLFCNFSTYMPTFWSSNQPTYPFPTFQPNYLLTHLLNNPTAFQPIYPKFLHAYQPNFCPNYIPILSSDYCPLLSVTQTWMSMQYGWIPSTPTFLESLSLQTVRSE